MPKRPHVQTHVVELIGVLLLFASGQMPAFAQLTAQNGSILPTLLYDREFASDPSLTAQANQGIVFTQDQPDSMGRFTLSGGAYRFCLTGGAGYYTRIRVATSKGHRIFRPLDQNGCIEAQVPEGIVSVTLGHQPWPSPVAGTTAVVRVSGLVAASPSVPPVPLVNSQNSPAGGYWAIQDITLNARGTFGNRILTTTPNKDSQLLIDSSTAFDALSLFQFPPISGENLGGNVTLTVGFYTEDNETAGHGTTGSIPNVPSTSPSITITNVQLPINSTTVYHHKQKTSLDAQGNHLWICSAAPAAPTEPTACAPAPGNICNYRGITYSPASGDVGYGWQSYNTSGCSGGAGQLDLLASLPNTNSGANAQQQYAALPCALQGSAKLVYDPLGRPGSNYYIDTTNNINILRQVTLGPTHFSDPRGNQAWGKFNLPPDDILLHPSGAIITINTVLSRMESLKLPASFVSDAQAAISLQANLHGGLGSRPGLFSAPTVATITAEGVILIVEAGNNRIHAVDASGNPVRHFTNQTEPYFLTLTATAGNDTQYLDIAAEYSGLIYVLSFSNSVYRLDIYAPDATGTSPLSTTRGFNAAKVTVDYWRNVYSLNYEVLTVNGAIPPGGITEPSVSQWIPTTPPPCDLRTPPRIGHRNRPYA